MNRRLRIAVGTILASGVLALVAALPAGAEPSTTPPPSGDDRATSVAGNATTCADAKLAGEIVIKDDDPDGQYLTIDPADIPDGYELTGTVVKGGNGYNVYGPQYLTNLHAPLVGQNGNVPTISHSFVCGVKKQKSTTPSTPPSAPSSSNSSGPGNPTSSGSSAPAVGGNTAIADDDLANTGFSATTPLVGGLGLLVVGAALLLILSRTRRQHD
jgi:LPXTG-motif cell wall-anchored protein